MSMQYRDYIHSKVWYRKHRGWLKQADYRCAMFPWVKVGKGKRYHCHHTNYKQLGDEAYWRDILVLSPFAHRYIIHGVLSGYKRPSQQKVYPNTAQRLAHHWCRVPALLRYAAVAASAAKLMEVALWLIK